MKILKYIFVAVVAIIAIPLILALFVRNDYQVKREVVINKPKAEVFNYVRFLKNQDNFSVWNMKDPNSERTYKGTDGTVGFVYGWNSQMDEVGEGEQEIMNITEGERIDMMLRFKRPFESNDTAYFETNEVSPSQTKLVWGFSGGMPYPMNIMLLFMDMDAMLGPELDKGLTNLKGVMEKQ